MKTYRVTVRVVSDMIFEVEAENKEDAKNEAIGMAEDGDTTGIQDMSNVTETKVLACEVVPE